MAESRSPVTLYQRVDPSVRKQKRRPITFQEALKRGQAPTASLGQAAWTPLSKTEHKKESSMAHATHTPIRELIEAEIEKRAVAKLAQRVSPLTIEQARAAAWGEDPELYALYYAVDETTTLSALEKMLHRRGRLATLGFENYGDAVAKTAHVLSPDDFSQGLEIVRERYPDLWAAHEREKLGQRT